jgi:hypothetical protein
MTQICAQPLTVVTATQRRPRWFMGRCGRHPIETGRLTYPVAPKAGGMVIPIGHAAGPRHLFLRPPLRPCGGTLPGAGYAVPRPLCKLRPAAFPGE